MKSPVEFSNSNLQSRASTAYIPPHRTQLHPRMLPYPPNPKQSPFPSTSKTKTKTKCLILFASLFIIPFLFYLFTTAHKIHISSKFSVPNSQFFGVVITVGPTRSRVRIFDFLAQGHIPFGSSSMELRLGLPELADDPGLAGVSIARLIRFAKRRVPKKEWTHTKVQFMARGDLGGFPSDLGVRDLEKILESCRPVLRSSGFYFKDHWARVIDGEDEGVYAWVAANYALGTLGGEPQETTGIVELGRASLQVTFATKETQQVQSSRILKLSGVIYYLYTQSFPKFGQDPAWESLHEVHSSRGLASFSSSSYGIAGNPCIPKGYELTMNASYAKFLTSHPAGNFSACRSEASSLLRRNQDKCLHPPCKIVSSFISELPGKPVSSENFLFTSELFGLGPRASLLALEAAGQHYCEDDWSKLKKQHPSIDNMDLLRYCFSSAYMVALLHDNLGIPMDEKRVGFANQTGSIPLDWTLGAFIIETMLEPRKLEHDDLGQIVGNESVTYFLLFAFLLIAVLATFFILQWRRPELKTIYDLEKGRYIVTHVPR